MFENQLGVLKAIREVTLRALVFVSISTLGFSSFALASGGDRIPGSRYVSARAAALGDSYIGLVDTVGDSLFYNPAGLGKVNGFTAEPINIGLHANTQLGSVFGRDFYKFQNLQSYEDTLKTHPGTNPGAGYSVLPSFGFRGFGVGLLYQSRLMAETDGANIRYRSMYQLIPAAGFGLRLASGVLRMGYSLQWVSQSSIDRTVPVGTRPLGWKEGINKGNGFSHNFGMAVTLPYMYTPTINVVARNIAGLKLGHGIADEDMSLDASLGFITKISAGWSLSSQFSYRDATNTSGTSTLAHPAVGLEFTALDRICLRAGYGSSYPSAGLGIKTNRSEVNFAWYSENSGTGSNPQRDVRYLFQFVFRAL